MRHLFLLLPVCWFLSCTQSPQNTGNKQTKADYLTFKYSQHTATMDMRDPSNWCTASFGEAAFISGDPKNYNRRVLALSNIPTRVIIDYGKMSAGFILHHTGNHVEVFTSENLPACLSNKANFQISPEGTEFRYDNKKDINFDVYLQELSNGIQIAIDFPPGGSYGISAYRCTTCN
jgi:hypothetical protein